MKGVCSLDEMKLKSMNRSFMGCRRGRGSKLHVNYIRKKTLMLTLY